VPKIGEAGAPSPGRKKGQVNKTTALLKDAILKAAEAAGGKGGTVAYLTDQATDNPAAFMGLLGKVLPLQVTGEDGGPVRVGVVEWHVVRPEAKT
jgi:hypothetical protein